jgi:hypothetical protein
MVAERGRVICPAIADGAWDGPNLARRKARIVPAASERPAGTAWRRADGLAPGSRGEAA